MLGDLLALGGFAFSCAVFFYLAASERSEAIQVEDYFLAKHSVDATRFSHTFVAASTSFATVILFFIATESIYGLTLLLCGLSYYLGQLAFIYWMKSSKIDTGELSTNAMFLLVKTGHKSLARAMSLLTIISFLMILFIELYVGSVIIKYYLPGAAGLTGALPFLLLGIIVFGYVRLGGLTTVIHTDSWQLRLMVLAACAFVAFALVVSPAGEAYALSNAFTVRASPMVLLLFYGWIFLLNFTLPFTQVSSWQRIAAARSIGEAWKGVLKGAPSFLVVWWLPVVALALLRAKGYEIGSIDSLFEVLRSGGSLAEAILYPMVFVGFTAALFSTADSALIALQLAVLNDTRLQGYLHRMSNERTKQIITGSSLATFVGLAIIYALAESKLTILFIPLVYTLFGQLAITAPQMFYALYYVLNGATVPKFTPGGLRFCVAAMFSGWLVLMGGTVLQTYEVLPRAGTQEVATFLAVLVSTIGLVGRKVPAPLAQSSVTGGSANERARSVSG